MPLSTFDIAISKAQVFEGHARPTYTVYQKWHTIAGLQVKITASFSASKELYVYYFVALTDVVTELEIYVQTSIINENGNKCRVTNFNRLFTTADAQGWGKPLGTFTTLGSIEKYVVGETLTLRVEIKDLIRKPLDRVLLERIYRSINPNEQALVDARLEEQTKCNKQQEATIAVLQTTIESVRQQLADVRKRKVEDMDTAASSSSSSSSSSAASPAAPADVTKLDDQQLGDLQEAIIKEKKKRNTCVICLENPIQITFIPCGHRKTCKECCEKLSETGASCPICRQTIERKIETF